MIRVFEFTVFTSLSLYFFSLIKLTSFTSLEKDFNKVDAITHKLMYISDTIKKLQQLMRLRSENNGNKAQSPCDSVLFLSH